MFNSICSAPRLQMCWRANFPTRIFHLSARSKDSDCAIRRLSAWIYKDTPGDLWKGQMYEIMHASVQYIYNYISVSSIINRIIQEREWGAALFSLSEKRDAQILREKGHSSIFACAPCVFATTGRWLGKKCDSKCEANLQGILKRLFWEFAWAFFKSQLHF